MAGAGYKLFNTGDVLTAAQVNTYLMQQTVMVFASSAARTSALSGVLAEGMVSYLQDTNTLEVYDGSSWVGATGDITGLTAGTGISISSATGPVPTITNDVATEFDAKGDLVVGTGADAFDKLSVGSNGDTLLADSSASTGLRWSAQPAASNPVVNGAYDIWQRGTSFSVAASTTTYTADRWQVKTSSNQATTVSRQTTSDTTNLPFIQYSVRVQRNSGQTGTGNLTFTQNMETVNSIPYAGKTVTMSFYAKRGANFSASGNNIQALLVTGTGTDQNVDVSGFTNGTNAIFANATLTTDWQRFTFTATLGATITQIAPYLLFTPTGTAGANDWYEVTGVQLDVGSVALPFRRSGNTLQGEIALAQRYYYRINATASAPWAAMAFGSAGSTTLATCYLPVKSEMRVIPTSVDFANLCLTADALASAQIAITNATLLAYNSTGQVGINFTATGLTQYRPYTVHSNNNSGGYLGVSAEL